MGNKHSDSTPRHSSQNRNPFFFVFARNGTGGFTAIEFIVVIVMLGILAGTVMMRTVFTTQDYGAIAADQLIADIQYVQMKAMGLGSRQKIIFTNGSGRYCVCNAPTCTYATCGATGELKTLPGNILISTTTFGTSLEFNTLGEPTYGTADGAVNLSGGQTVTVHGITGKVE
ncbi:MAG: pilus assembly FimT family protein [Syntrophorhabdaceae bacterium]